MVSGDSRIFGGMPTPTWSARLPGGIPAFWLAANIATAALYLALGAIVSSFFAAYGLFPAPIWLPAAIAMVAAVVGEWRLFPGIFVGSFATNALLFAPPLYITTIISLTNALGPVVGAAALRWLRTENGIFTSFVGVVRFLFCTVILSPAISATGGALAMALGHSPDWERIYGIWVSWWLCDSGGTLYLAPALLLWIGLEREDAVGSRPAERDWTHLAVWAAIAVGSLMLFLTPPLHGSPVREAFPFLLVVPLSWVALRMSLRSAYTLISLVAVTAAAGTVAGFGPFRDPAVANPLQMVGTLVVVLAMNVLTTVALVSELREARTQNRVKSMFLATTSHELRSPLNAILGFSSLIDGQVLGPLANEKYADYARLIHTAGEHLLSLIDGLLDLSKLEAGRFALDEEPISVAETAEEAVAFVSMQAQAKSIALTVEVLPPDMTIAADARALRQILLNLLSNAVKFTANGGSVAVTAGISERGEAEIRVRDTGIGIPAKAIDRVFTPFERLRSDAEGTGLGLSITRGLVRLHDGTIRLESELGRGTTAIVRLPAARVIAAAVSSMARMAEAAD